VTSQHCVEIPGAADTGGPFIVGDTLTIYQAAMACSGRHPGGRFVDGTTEYERASLREYESYLGKGARGGPRKLAWDIYCELRERVKTGRIIPLRTAYLSDGEIDPRDTIIATAAVAELASERGESPKFLCKWMPAGSKLAPPSKRTRKSRDLAIARLKRKYLNSEIPARSAMSDMQIHNSLKEPNETKPPFGVDTTRRALNEFAPNRRR
jgi:hypothetical protein